MSDQSTPGSGATPGWGYHLLAGAIVMCVIGAGADLVGGNPIAAISVPIWAAGGVLLGALLYRLDSRIKK